MNEKEQVENIQWLVTEYVMEAYYSSRPTKDDRDERKRMSCFFPRQETGVIVGVSSDGHGNGRTRSCDAILTV